ncbi:kunitz-type protease inhibitor 2 [Enoplosus armatus]|uniref:kunitz-type protease inhibitor 2 n=1 Tax=Enoplosus armatus TaxID=215367 RepID=UPI003993CFD1
MNQQRFRSTLLAVCFLVCTGMALDCEWDQSTDPDQGLDPASVDAAALNLGQITEVSDSESCRAACCGDPGCDLALVGYPAGGRPQCLLVSCVIRDLDACVLQFSTQFKVYRKKVTTETHREAKKDGERPHLVSLLRSSEPKTNETKTNETSETNNIRCRLPMKVGSCRASFTKFYYDVTNQSCRSFIYGGCKANGNNFQSQDECEATCSGVTGSVLPDESTPPPPPRQRHVKAARLAPAVNTKVSQDVEGPVESEPAATEPVHTQETEMSADDFAERCGAEPQVGPCRAAFQHWYYNSETGSCQSFIYGGCRGNKNNYVSKESCIAACAVTVLPSSKKAAAAAADDDDNEYKDQCTVTPDPGPCRAAFFMFYYDPNTATCQSFVYGGCHGNQNRYGTVEECMTRCSGDGRFEGHGRTRNRWTAAIFLFVTLAAISALLLATLIIVTLRRHSLSRRPSSTSDKEELLPDPDEQSSVESLTVPESPKPDKA